MWGACWRHTPQKIPPWGAWFSNKPVHYQPSYLRFTLMSYPAWSLSLSVPCWATLYPKELSRTLWAMLHPKWATYSVQYLCAIFLHPVIESKHQLLPGPTDLHLLVWSSKLWDSICLCMSDWSTLMTPQKDTLDSKHTLLWFISYRCLRRLSPQFSIFSVCCSSRYVSLEGGGGFPLLPVSTWVHFSLCNEGSSESVTYRC